MKKFTISCDFNQEKFPFDVYIELPAEGQHPLRFQSHWLATVRGGIIPEDVMDSFQRLLDLAKKNEVDFGELCEYAYDSTNREKKGDTSKKTENPSDN